MGGGERGAPVRPAPPPCWIDTCRRIRWWREITRGEAYFMDQAHWVRNSWQAENQHTKSTTSLQTPLLNAPLHTISPPASRKLAPLGSFLLAGGIVCRGIFRSGVCRDVVRWPPLMVCCLLFLCVCELSAKLIFPTLWEKLLNSEGIAVACSQVEVTHLEVERWTAPFQTAGKGTTCFVSRHVGILPKFQVTSHRRKGVLNYVLAFYLEESAGGQ